MNRTRLSLCLFTLLTLAVCVPAYSDIEYRFASREQLDRELEQWVGKKVTVTDRLSMVYSGTVQGHMLFDTHYFRCAIPTSGEGSEYLKDIFQAAKVRFDDLREELKKAKSAAERNEVNKKIYKRWKKKALVTLYGRVARPEFWGKVDEPSRGAGVVSERIIIVCDKAEKPRARWYEEIK